MLWLLVLSHLAWAADHPATTSPNELRWWPRALPADLHNSQMGTTQQQIIGAPPSWGLGCPSPQHPRVPTFLSGVEREPLEARLRRQQHRPHRTCPPPCPASDLNQCLRYLKPSGFATLCNNQTIHEFSAKVTDLRLPFCCEHSVDSVLMASLEDEDATTNNNNNNARSNTFNNKEVPVSRRLLRTFECNRHLEALLSLDRLARKAAHLFDAVLERYDCGQSYSVHFHCDDCKVSLPSNRSQMSVTDEPESAEPSEREESWKLFAGSTVTDRI
jgi:hypothetical protein